MITRIHLRSGQVCEFDLEIPDTDQLIKAIKPREFFKRTSHLVLGQLMMVTLNPAEIEWVELEGKPLKKLPGLAESISVQELSREEFNRRLAKNKIAIQTMMQQGIAPETLLTYGQATFKSGKVLLIETQALLSNAKNRLSIAMKIFDQPALFVQTETGLLIVNPKNIAIWQVVPGMLEGPPHSIRGELLKVSVDKPKRSS